MLRADLRNMLRADLRNMLRAKLRNVLRAGPPKFIKSRASETC